MTSSSRLTKVEAGLSPTELVVRWLAEAHAFDDLAIYTRSLVEADPPISPVDQLVDQAEANARLLARGRPRDDAEQDVRRAIVGTVFRFQLALRINILANEFLDREALLQGVLSAHLALALTADERPKERAMLSVPKVRDLLFIRVGALHALQTARDQAESRYLGGAQALFPAGLRAWEGQRHDSEREAVIADRLAELDGCEPALQEPQADIDARVVQLLADHVEPARSNAYEQVGDGRRAMALAVRWLRPKLADDPR